MRRNLSAASGLRAKFDVLRIKFAGKGLGGSSGVDAAPWQIRMKGLGGRPLYVRPGTTDLITAVDDYVEGVHLPPAEVQGREMSQIVELGSNTGNALAEFAFRHPQARIVGVEADPGNAEIARLNIAAFGGRCELVQAGIWDDDLELVVEGDKAFGYTVRPAEPGDSPELPRIDAITVDSLLERHMPEGPIDFLTMTIEGTEPRVLRKGGDWVERTRAIRVETYPHWDFPTEAAVEELRRLGFEARPSRERSEKWALGFRR